MHEVEDEILPRRPRFQYTQSCVWEAEAGASFLNNFLPSKNWENAFFAEEEEEA